MTPATTPQHLTLVIDGANYSSVSDEDIELDRPYWLYREIRRLPEGEYLVRAILTSYSSPVVRSLTIVRH